MRLTAALCAFALLPIASQALAIELPKRKSGLWDIMAAQPGAPAAPSGQVCIDEKTDDLARQLGSAAMHCSKQELSRDGDAYLVDSVCRIGESTATTRARITGTFDAAYQVNVDSKYEPALRGMREGRAIVTARWLGPCKPGQRAGDMTLPGGVTINILDVQKGAPGK